MTVLGHAESWSVAERAWLASFIPKPMHDTSNRFAGNEAAIRLGRALFFEPRLSRNGQVSCASCHQPERAFTDGRAQAFGLHQGTRNTPTLVNTAYQRWQFWDGRADSLWMQALGPMASPIEMHTDWAAAVELLRGDAELARLFRAAFPDTSLPDKSPSDSELAEFQVLLAKAVAAFEMTIVQFASPFDAFIRPLENDGQPDETQLSAPARRGLRLFIGKAGCVNCHFGPSFSDGEFHDIGLAVNGSDGARAYALASLAQSPFNRAGRFSDDVNSAYLPAVPSSSSEHNSHWGAFKTPTLRNLTLTAPYMHDGRFASLDAVIAHYANPAVATHNPLLSPKAFTAQEQQDLIAFLVSLSGPVSFFDE